MTAAHRRTGDAGHGDEDLPDAHLAAAMLCIAEGREERVIARPIEGLSGRRCYAKEGQLKSYSIDERQEWILACNENRPQNQRRAQPDDGHDDKYNGPKCEPQAKDRRKNQENFRRRHAIAEKVDCGKQAGQTVCELVQRRVSCQAVYVSVCKETHIHGPLGAQEEYEEFSFVQNYSGA